MLGHVRCVGQCVTNGIYLFRLASASTPFEPMRKFPGFEPLETPKQPPKPPKLFSTYKPPSTTTPTTPGVGFMAFRRFSALKPSTLAKEDDSDEDFKSVLDSVGKSIKDALPGESDEDFEPEGFSGKFKIRNSGTGKSEIKKEKTTPQQKKAVKKTTPQKKAVTKKTPPKKAVKKAPPQKKAVHRKLDLAEAISSESDVQPQEKQEKAECSVKVMPSVTERKEPKEVSPKPKVKRGPGRPKKISPKPKEEKVSPKPKVKKGTKTGSKRKIDSKCQSDGDFEPPPKKVKSNEKEESNKEPPEKVSPKSKVKRGSGKPKKISPKPKEPKEKEESMKEAPTKVSPKPKVKKGAAKKLTPTKTGSKRKIVSECESDGDFEPAVKKVKSNTPPNSPGSSVPSFDVPSVKRRKPKALNVKRKAKKKTPEEPVKASPEISPAATRELFPQRTEVQSGRWMTIKVLEHQWEQHFKTW